MINNTTELSISQETSNFALKVGIVTASIVGIWGVTCLVSALLAVGPTGLIAGYVMTLGL